MIELGMSRLGKINKLLEIERICSDVGCYKIV